jgi:SepF-like predicted cell division protein (DUF552 family)
LPKVSKALKEYKATSNPNYSYIIIDEIHDSLDRGALEILKELSAINSNGLTNGRYMVFFDGLQGYNNQGRNLEKLASEISDNSAMFTLTKNRRVPQNSEIHEISNQIREADSYDEIQDILKDIETGNNLPIKIQHFSDTTSLVTEILKKTGDVCNNSKGEQYVLLTHSNIDKTIWQGEVTITGIIDWERAMWGEALMDEPFRYHKRNPQLLEGFGVSEFSKSEMRRIFWYDVFLYLTMMTEVFYREYEDDGQYKWTKMLFEEVWEKNS